MNITGWPYPVTVDGDVSAGGPATVTIAFHGAAPSEVYTATRYAIETFAALATAGGLGGDQVDPLRSTAALASTAPLPGGRRVAWDFTAIAIDPRGLAVLFDMLTLLAPGIHSVTVQAQGTGPRSPFGSADLPPRWRIVPFGLDDDRTSKNVELRIEFASPLTPADEEIVVDAVGVWLDAGSVQGYRDWTERPERSFLAPTEDPPFSLDGNELTALLEDSGVAEGCWHILANVLVKLHARAPIVVAEIV